VIGLDDTVVVCDAILDVGVGSVIIGGDVVFTTGRMKNNESS
jgi:hypothetical protein